MTTAIQEKPAGRVARDTQPAKATAAVPRHLALVLNAPASRVVTQLAADAVVRAILEGSASAGVAVLTLVRPGTCGEVFNAALNAARAAGSGLALQINVASPRNGREELLDAVRHIATKAKRAGVAPTDIRAEMIESGLATAGLPDVDLCIVTGGGRTLSGAMIWQSAYAELLFSERDWCDFASVDLTSALNDYAKRCRKFGGLS